MNNKENILQKNTGKGKMTSLCKAMAEAFREIEGAVKDKDNPFFRSKYADLGNVVDAIKPALANHGLWFIQKIHPTPGIASVETIIMHESGEGLDEGDEAGRGDGSCAHWAYVGGPEFAGAHEADELGAGVDGLGEAGSEEVDQGHEDEPGEDAAGEDNAGDFRSDDVADAEIFRSGVAFDSCAFEDMLGAEVGLIAGGIGPCCKEIAVLEESVDAAQAKAEEDAAGERTTAIAGHQDVSAGGAFGVGEGGVFFDNELAAEGDHEEDAEPSADEGEEEDAGVFEVEAEEDEGGEGEDDA